ncbi:hypothetical protein MNEG_10405 [Monoraphidium neglectum]|uniref:Uncharacterized protein n=1 Tax=Monoraphidium neglectum TaxID=145388 RepID=A0A0D2JD63_9CHLO|nr:hypothetical protein MNEG_10405 [Monoraphidium neglectum]KIY97557.1 hypothetical protein MNEG_10405 [Monoraphidium neglectum]|eukprot:XP_013896577.1 hypothetical protein MNEG_10405 [Monoraphidium neglectum]
MADVQPTKKRRLLDITSKVDFQGPGQQGAAAAVAAPAGTLTAASIVVPPITPPRPELDAGACDNDGELDVPSDVEAAVMLLKAELYGAVAAAACAKQRRPPAAQQQQQQQQQQQSAAWGAGGLPPFVLKAHIYTVVSDRTAADRDLDDLLARGRARAFRLATGADEHVVLLMSDYLALISSIIAHKDDEARQGQLRQLEGQRVEAAEQAAPGPGARAVVTAPAAAAAAAAALRRFRDRVAPRCRDASISVERLLQLLAGRDDSSSAGGGDAPGRRLSQQQQQQQQQQQPPQQQQGQRGQRHHHQQQPDGARRTAALPHAGKHAGPAAAAAATARSGDADVSHLLAAELLSRDSLVPGRLTFTVPGAGRIVRWLVDGRQELTQALSKKRFGEALEKELLKLKLRRSTLGVRFHLRDLIGRGTAARGDSPAGPVIRLARP